MAGYIGKSQSVTQVDGYTQTEADSKFVDTSGDTMTGELIIGNDADTVLTLDRDTTDGPIIDLQKDGTSGGLIGVNGGRAFFARTSGGGVKLASSYGLEPCNGIGNDWDGVPSLGSSVNRFSNLHLKNNIYAKAMALKDTGSSHYNGIRCIDNNKIGFNTKGLERMRIDSAGRVTMPYQPAFRVNATSNQVLGTGWQTVGYTALLTQRGSSYNTGTSRFTAPVAGWYQFNAGWTAAANSDNDGTLSISINGSTSDLVNSTSMPNTSGSYDGHFVSGCAYLNANDYVSIIRYSTVNTTTRLSTQYGGWFSGFLIG